MKPLEHFINPKTIDEFAHTMRLSKRLARMGVASRRQSEKLISQGMVKVDGQIVNSNVPVTEDNVIQLIRTFRLSENALKELKATFSTEIETKIDNEIADQQRHQVKKSLAPFLWVQKLISAKSDAGRADQFAHQRAAGRAQPQRKK